MRIPYGDWQRFQAVLKQSTSIQDLLDRADDDSFQLLLLLLDRQQAANVAYEAEQFLADHGHPFAALALAQQPISEHWDAATTRVCLRARRLASTHRLQLLFRQEICSGGDQYTRLLSMACKAFDKQQCQALMGLGVSPSPECYQQLCGSFSLLLDISPDLSTHDELFEAMLPLITHPQILREIKVGLDRCGAEDDALRARGIAALARECIPPALLTHLCSNNLQGVELAASFLADLVRYAPVDLAAVMVSEGNRITAQLVATVTRFAAYLQPGCGSPFPCPTSEAAAGAGAVSPPAGLTKHSINKVLHCLLLVLRIILDCLDSRAPDGFLFGCRFFTHQQVLAALQPQLLADLINSLLSLVHLPPQVDTHAAATAAAAPVEHTPPGKHPVPSSGAAAATGLPFSSPQPAGLAQSPGVVSPAPVQTPSPGLGPTTHTTSTPSRSPAQPYPQQQPEASRQASPTSNTPTPALPPPPLTPPVQLSCQLLIDLLHIVSSCVSSGFTEFHQVVGQCVAYPRLLSALQLHPLSDPLHASATAAVCCLCQNAHSSLLHQVFHKQGLINTLASLPHQITLPTSGRTIRPSYIPSLGRMVMCLEACTDQCVSSTAGFSSCGGVGSADEDEPMTPTHSAVLLPALRTPQPEPDADTEAAPEGLCPQPPPPSPAQGPPGYRTPAPPPVPPPAPAQQPTLDESDALHVRVLHDTWEAAGQQASPGGGGTAAEAAEEVEEPAAWVLWQALQQSRDEWSHLLSLTHAYRAEAGVEARSAWQCGPLQLDTATLVQLDNLVCVTSPQLQAMCTASVEQEMFDSVCEELVHEVGLEPLAGAGPGPGTGQEGDTAAEATAVGGGQDGQPYHHDHSYQAHVQLQHTDVRSPDGPDALEASDDFDDPVCGDGGRMWGGDVLGEAVDQQAMPASPQVEMEEAGGAGGLVQQEHEQQAGSGAGVYPSEQTMHQEVKPGHRSVQQVAMMDVELLQA